MNLFYSLNRGAHITHLSYIRSVLVFLGITVLVGCGGFESNYIDISSRAGDSVENPTPDPGPDPGPSPSPDPEPDPGQCTTSFQAFHSAHKKPTLRGFSTSDKIIEIPTPSAGALLYADPKDSEGPEARTHLVGYPETDGVTDPRTNLVGEPVPVRERDPRTNLVGDPERGAEPQPLPVNTLLDYVALYDRDCLEMSPANLRAALFKDNLTERRQRYQAESIKVSLADLQRMEAELRRDPCLVAFVPNDQVHLVGDVSTQEFSKEPLRSQQTHIAFVKAQKLWDEVYNKSDFKEKIVVAVIDTGVTLNHEDLRSRMWADEQGRQGANFVNPSRSADDDNNHGTHVAGLIAADGTNGIGGIGIAPKEVLIMPLKALTAQGSGSMLYVVNAINYAAENGAHIINLSLGGPGRVSILKSAIENAVEAGVFVVAAAGNDNVEISEQKPFSPAMYAKDIQGFISVGSQNTGTGNKSSFSNYSTSYVEIFAPGAEASSSGLRGLISTIPGPNRYGRAAGTSMASPVVAGAAALVFRAFLERGLDPEPHLIESFLGRYARANTSLTRYGLGGHALDLELLAQGINTELGPVGCR